MATKKHLGTATTLARFEERWTQAGNPPRPRVSQAGTPTTVAARQWASFVASAYLRPRP